jgi:hypothetical protein
LVWPNASKQIYLKKNKNISDGKIKFSH